MSKYNYCPNCECYNDSEIQLKKEEVINVRGVPIKLKNIPVRMCLKCKNDMYDYELDTPTLIKAYEKYEEKTGKPILEELLKKSADRAGVANRVDRTDTDRYIKEAIERLNKKKGKK